MAPMRVVLVITLELLPKRCHLEKSGYMTDIYMFLEILNKEGGLKRCHILAI